MMRFSKYLGLTLVSVMLLFAAELNAQQAGITLKDVPLSKAITEIQKSTGYSVVVKAEGLDLSRTISLTINAEDPKAAVGQLFAGQDVDVTVNDKTVIVSRKPVPSPYQDNHPTV